MTMKHENQPLDLKRIVLKPRDYLIIPNETSREFKFPDRVIPVKPLDDTWLAAPEREWGEIDQVIEGRLSGFQQNRLTGENISLPQARLLAYADMMNEQQLLQQSLNAKAEELKGKYEKEKLGKKVYLRNRLYQTKYAPEINRYTRELIKEQRITSLILRKAVMEMFSPPDEAGLLLGNIPAIIEDMPDTERKGVRQLLNHVADYLQETKDKDLYTRYHYRKSPDLAKKHTDVQVLTSALEMVLNPEYERLAKSYFVFLKNRSQQTPEFGAEPYPRLSLLYDTLVAGFASANMQVLQKIGPDIIEGIYSPILKRNYIDQEVERLVTAHRVAHKSVKELAEAMGSKAAHYFSIMGFLPADKVPLPIEQILASDDLRIEEGLVTITNRAHGLDIGGLEKQIPTIGKILKLFAEKNSRAIGRYTQEEFGRMREIDVYLLMLPRRQVNNKLGVEEDLTIYLLNHINHVHDTSRPGPELGFTTESWRKERQTVVDGINIAPGDKTEHLLSNYFLYNWQQEKSNSDQRERQNEHLRREILDKSVWFVSPRGDRFVSERDEELKDKEISSITFHPDAKYPREHRVTMKLTGDFEPIRLWLDTNGKLLKGDRTPLGLDTAYYQILNNVILKRLFVITSGILSTSEDQEYEESEAERLPIAWRRAHYRIYKAGSRFTMQSEGAQEHAREILQVYGIDIYKEIKRRQEIGTLLPNQVLTFVREIAPKLPSGQEDTKPNELPFDPAWIPTKF